MHKSAMRAPLELSKLFADGRVARIVDKSELDKISSDSTAYGFAMALNKNFDVVKHMKKGDPPRPLGDGEFALIATHEILKIHFLSEAQDDIDDKRVVSIKLGRLTETDSGREHTVRLKATLEFQIDRYNRTVGDEIHVLMKEHDTDRLTKKALLSDMGNNLKEGIQNFLQIAINKMGSENLGMGGLQTYGREELSSLMQDRGLVFKRIICNIDKRSIGERLPVEPMVTIDKHSIGERLPAEPMVTSAEHQCAVCEPSNRRLREDLFGGPVKRVVDDDLGMLSSVGNVARVVSDIDLGMVSSNCTAYGAVILDEDFNVVKHMDRGDPPHQLGDDELALIVDTHNVFTKRYRFAGFRRKEISVEIDFCFARHNRRVGNVMLAVMEEWSGNVVALTPEQWDFIDPKEEIDNFLKTALDKGELYTSSGQDYAVEKLGPIMQDLGLVLKNITLNI